MEIQSLEQFFNNPRTILLFIWALAWKGYALWRAANNDQQYWYIALLIVNLLGILEIIYLLFFQKKDKLWEKIFKKR